MSLKIGIKFCGGCNPYYPRSGAVKKYIEEHPGYDYEFLNDKEEYDLIVIVCGCMCRCVTHDHLKSKHGFVIVSSLDDFRLRTERVKAIEEGKA